MQKWKLVKRSKTYNMTDIPELIAQRCIDISVPLQQLLFKVWNSPH